MHEANISIAAEVLGRTHQSDTTKYVLIGLLSHPSPVVREGAVIGLWFVMDDNVREILTSLLATDPSEGVRLTIEDVLDETWTYD